MRRCPVPYRILQHFSFILSKFISLQISLGSSWYHTDVFTSLLAVVLKYVFDEGALFAYKNHKKVDRGTIWWFRLKCNWNVDKHACCSSSVLQSSSSSSKHTILLLITLQASCSAVYCNQSCLWVGVCVCVWITRNCVHRSHQTWFVGKGSEHLQLIKFWPSRAPWNGVCGRAKSFGSALLQPVCSVCASECFLRF